MCNYSLSNHCWTRLIKKKNFFFFSNELILIILKKLGEGLDLDMKDFAYYVYKLFYSLLENNGESVHLGIECLEHLFLKKRQISYERIAAYAKRLTTLCCHLPHNGVLASIALCNLLFQVCEFSLLLTLF